MPRIETPAACRALGEAAGSAGIPLYLVGGAVRNPLLGLPAADVDVCGPRRPEELEALERSGIQVSDTVNGLGTALLLLEEGGSTRKLEYTAFRTDSYVGRGAHRPSAVRFTPSIEEDAARRDFTVNALYAHPVTGEVLDPLGKGLSDLEARVLRMTHPETMREDALRILRLARFASELGFDVDAGTLAAAKEGVPGLASISRERVWQEFSRILLSDVPYGSADAPLRGLLLLRDLGALGHILPELMEGDGFAQNPRYHRYDVLEHQLRACAATQADLATRLAGLLHDVAKPSVHRRDGNMYAHAQEGAAMAKKALRRLGAPASLASDVSALIAEHMFDLDGNARPPAVRRRILRLGQEQFRRLINLRVADFSGSGMGHAAASADRWERVLDAMIREGAPFRASHLAVSGSDIMRELDMPPGPQVGQILEKLLLYAAGRPSQNSYDCLLRYARMIRGTKRPGRSRADRDGQDGGPKSV